MCFFSAIETFVLFIRTKKSAQIPWMQQKVGVLQQVFLYVRHVGMMRAPDVGNLCVYFISPQPLERMYKTVGNT